MTCDTGAHGSPDPKTTDWVASLPIRTNKTWDDTAKRLAGKYQISWDNPLEFALFGLARQAEFPRWVQVDMDKPILDLGPGNKMIHGAIRCEYPDYNFESPLHLPECTGWNHDCLNAPEGQKYYLIPTGYQDRVSKYRCVLPFASDSIGGIYAVNILEHLWDPRPILEECARVLAPGAPLNIVVPHGSHGIYLQDLDHKKPFILDSWKNWLSNGYWGPDRSNLRLRVGVNFKFGIKEENVNIMTQLIKEPK